MSTHYSPQRSSVPNPYLDADDSQPRGSRGKAARAARAARQQPQHPTQDAPAGLRPVQASRTGASGRAATRQAGARRTRDAGGAQGLGHYLDADSYIRANQARSSASGGGIARFLPISAGVLLFLAALWFFVLAPKPFDITVNGQTVTVHEGDTAELVATDKYATFKPGNMVAVDGTLIEEGAGDPYSVVINGKEAKPDTKLAKDDVVEIGDGKDTTEPAQTTEEALPFKNESSSTEFGAYWNGSIHLLSDGEDGVLTKKTGEISGKHVEEVTTPAKNAGYQIYTTQTEDKVVALTFDDGPWPETTAQILDILEENDAKATFFTVGNLVADGADDVKRAREMGCEILTHSWDHAEGTGQGVSLALMSAEEQKAEIEKGYAAIKDVTGEEPLHVIRAPGGNFFGDLITNVWDLVDAEIGWDVDTEDWRLPGVDSIEAMILSAQPGQVVLMHDGGGDRTQTVEALRSALPKLKEQGYSFITVSELLAYGPPQSGEAATTDTTTTDAAATDGTESGMGMGMGTDTTDAAA